MADDEIVSAVAWAPDGQLLSCSDDKNVCRWSADGEMLGKFSIGVFVTSMSWFPSTGKQVSLTHTHAASYRINGLI